MKLKTKDFIFLGIMSIIGMVLYMIAMSVSSMFGAFGHSISPGIFGLVSGTLFVFMCYKLGKPGMMTIFTAVQMLVFSMMGGAYLPWLITSMTAAVIADIVLAFGGFKKAWTQMIAWSLIQFGSACGAFVPIWFFAESFTKDWIERGQSAESMNAQIMNATGILGVISVVSVLGLSVLGVLIGRRILRKYFSKA